MRESRSPPSFRAEPRSLHRVAGALCVFGGGRRGGEGGAETGERGRPLEGRRGGGDGTAAMRLSTQDGMVVEVVGLWGNGRWRLWGRWVEYKWICLDNIGESLNFVGAWKALHDCIAA